MRDRLFELPSYGCAFRCGPALQPRAPAKLLHADHELVQTHRAISKVRCVMNSLIRSLDLFFQQFPVFFVDNCFSMNFSMLFSHLIRTPHILTTLPAETWTTGVSR